MKKIIVCSLLFLSSTVAFGQQNRRFVEPKLNKSIETVAVPIDLEAHGSPNDVVLNLIPDRDLRILYKPKASWPENTGCFQGTVILRVTFLETGQIGNISVVKGLPLGATDKAVEAARKIKFDPAVRSGKAISSTKQVEFSFSIY